MTFITPHAQTLNQVSTIIHELQELWYHKTCHVNPKKCSSRVSAVKKAGPDNI